MGHGTLVDGTQRLVTAGLDLIDGVQRKQKKGLTLVDGVQRDILFSGGTITVEISGTLHASYGYVTINGEIISSAGSYEYNKPLEISVTVSAATVSGQGSCYVTKNGTSVKTGSGTYTFITEANKVLITFERSSGGMRQYYHAAITEE